VCIVIAAYAFGRVRRPQPRPGARERAGRSDVVHHDSHPRQHRKAALVISGPVTFEMADSAYRERRYDDATVLFQDLHGQPA